MTSQTSGASLSAPVEKREKMNLRAAYRVQTNDKRDVFTTINERLIALMQAGVVAWRPTVRDRHEALKPPVNGFSNRPYHGVNTLILMAEAIRWGYRSNRWCTFHQCDQLGGRVQKGQKGAPIVFAKYIDKKDCDGKVILDKDGNPEQRYFLSYTFAFNLGQTTIKIDEDEEEGLDPVLRQGKANDLLMAYIEREGITLTHVGDRAYYQPRADLINLPSFDRALSPARWFESGFHESVHSTGHAKRLGRLEDEKALSWGDANYAKEELVAELGAAYLMAEYGIFEQEERNLAEYIRHWIGVLQNDKRLIFKASAKAQTAVAFLKTGAAA